MLQLYNVVLIKTKSLNLTLQLYKLQVGLETTFVSNYDLCLIFVVLRRVKRNNNSKDAFVVFAVIKLPNKIMFKYFYTIVRQIACEDQTVENFYSSNISHFMFYVKIDFFHFMEIVLISNYKSISKNILSR